MTVDKTDAYSHGPMSYRPPSKAPTGAWARHLHEQRRERDLSATQAFELVYERVGWSAKSRTAYVAIDSGTRQPNKDEAAVLGTEFGWPPDPDATEPAPDLASALAALTAELTQMRLEREAWTRGVAEVLRSYADGRVPVALLDALVPPLREDALP